MRQTHSLHKNTLRPITMSGMIYLYADCNPRRNNHALNTMTA
jgi:hypothetical protein